VLIPFLHKLNVELLLFDLSNIMKNHHKNIKHILQHITVIHVNVMLLGVKTNSSHYPLGGNIRHLFYNSASQY